MILANHASHEASPDARVRRTLTRVIRSCQDAEKLYGDAASDVQDASLKGIFDDFAYQRAVFACVLQEVVVAHGGPPRNVGTVAGAIHRGWLDVVSALIGRDVRALLVECERGEDVVEATYESALAEGLPARVEGLLSEQLAAIRATHDELRRLRGASGRLLGGGAGGRSHA